MQQTKGAEVLTLITGVIGEDVHIIGIRILEHALRKAGFNVVSLGIHVSQKEFIQAAIETKANAILVSSLGGHAEILLRGFKESCIESGLKNVKLYLGGHLVIGELRWPDIESRFKKMGFDAVYPPDVLPPKIVADLKRDLSLQPA